MLNRRQRKAFSILSLVIAVAIVGILAQNYYSTDTPTGEPWAVYTTNRTRQVAALANFRLAQTQYLMQTEGRRPEINQLRAMLDSMSNMASGGRFFVDPSDQLRVTNQLETRKFSELYNSLPSTR